MSLSPYVLVLVILCCFNFSFASTDEKNKKDEKKDTKTTQENESLKCGITYASSTQNASNVRVIDAREAQKGAWPWMAELYVTRRNKTSPTCAGALISRNYVISAGHCLTDRRGPVEAKDVSVRLGEHDLKSDKDGMKPVDVKVASLHIHSDHDPITFQNDIALLRLEHPVNFTKDIQPLCLPNDSLNEEVLFGRNGYVAGWGTTSWGFLSPSSDALTEMSVIITDDEFCRNAYSPMTTVTEGNICAVGINGSSPCQGFAGAPLMLPGGDNRYYIIGIVSFGRGCGNPEYPDVYTKVSTFLDWIREHRD